MDRLKRLGLVALMAFLALNVWTGSPLLSLWIGSRIQGSARPCTIVAKRCTAEFTSRSSVFENSM